MPEIRVIEPIIFAPAEKLRVCAYARVSSDSTDQRNSFASQVNYYTKYIQAHEGWTFVDIYADQGITGTSALKRDGFSVLCVIADKEKLIEFWSNRFPDLHVTLRTALKL